MSVSECSLRKRWVCGGWIGSGIVGGMVGRSSLYFWIKVLIAGCLLSLRWPGVSGETNDESDLELYEEYRIEGPIDTHRRAVDHYLKERARDPESFNLSDSSPVMRSARSYAEKRLFVPSEDSLKLRSRVSKTLLELDGGSGEVLQTLPAPSSETLTPKDYLSDGLMRVQGESSEVMSLEVASSLAAAVQDDIALGAIAKAGALAARGEDGQEMGWIEFAEKKLQRDANLDHQSLLWFMGSQQIELEQQNRSNVNVTLQEQKFEHLLKWIEMEGGSVFYGSTQYSRSSGPQLIATEDIADQDKVISVPLKLIMCRITSRNVVIKNRGNYLGEALKKTFEKNEMWGLTFFLLHEWFKEHAGSGSKWGPLIRSLSMRSLTTQVVSALDGTTAVELMKRWMKDIDGMRAFSTEIDGPCGYTKGVCVTKPNEKIANDGKFDIHHLRWAYWVVSQNAVRVKHKATGKSFMALIPFVNTMRKSVSNDSTVSFELDGSVSVLAHGSTASGTQIALSTGNFNDAEFFTRFFETPKEDNPFNGIKLALPGTLAADSKFNYCLKDPSAARKDECRDGSLKGETMMWRSRVLTEWRKAMNMPPRLGDIRMWAMRLHIYGDTEEEEKLLNAANQKIAGLPVPTDVLSAEEQLMLLGVARDNDEASLMLFGEEKERPQPQLYSAPDPKEDSEAQRVMEHLASLAVQLQTSLSSGSDYCNATKQVINATRDFFQHGVLPKAGLDELDQYLLKKLGMITHCGVDKDMMIQKGTITKQLLCAMRVYLMNETEIHTFCPARIKYFEDNCQQVEFMNYTAVSQQNELSVIAAFRATLSSMLSVFSTSIEEDRLLVKDHESGVKRVGPLLISAIRLRLREKALMQSAVDYLDNYEEAVKAGAVEFQLESKIREREREDQAEAERLEFASEIQRLAAIRDPLVVLPIDLGKSAVEGLNITLLEGDDLSQIVRKFANKYGVSQADISILESNLRQRIQNPKPLLLQMGVVVPSGAREILAIPQDSNVTLETRLFCARNNITALEDCERILERVKERIESNTFTRSLLLVVPVDSPDGRSIKLIVREGEQHDLLQHAADFLQLYKMPIENAEGLANELHRRLPEVALRIPVSLQSRRQVAARFSSNDNITNVVEAFCNFYEIDDSRIQLLKLARSGMAPGSFVV